MFLRNASFSLTVRTVVQVEHISGYLDCVLEFGELAFPLDLISRSSQRQRGKENQAGKQGLLGGGERFVGGDQSTGQFCF